MTARRSTAACLVSTVVAICAFATVHPLAAQTPAATPPQTDSQKSTRDSPGKTQQDTLDAAKPTKIYVAGYAIVILMIGLGVLVVCQARSRAERPELRGEEFAERLRTMSGPRSQKGG